MLCFAHDEMKCGPATHVWLLENVYSLVCAEHVTACIANGYKVRPLGGK